MSLITRCPACGTMFKVVPDQLRISEGWVRCGHCSEVFDAQSHLQTLSPLGEPPAPPPPSVEQDQALQIAEVDAGTVAAEGSVDELAKVHLDADVVPEEAPLASMPDEPVLEVPVSSGAMLVNPESQFEPSSPYSDDSPDDDVRRRLEAQRDRDGASAAVISVPDSILDEDVSFVREARRKALWRRPVVRIALATCALLLTGVLVVQVAVHERDRLAALEPELKPWLARLCGQLGCTIAVPRQIESVVIDSSTFNKVRNDVFRLGFTIRNTSGVEVATPALELTLTDTQDQPVLRRVFRPEEAGAGPSLASRGEWNAVLNMSVDANGAGRVSGYRLLAFYP